MPMLIIIFVVGLILSACVGLLFLAFGFVRARTLHYLCKPAAISNDKSVFMRQHVVLVGDPERPIRPVRPIRFASHPEPPPALRVLDTPISEWDTRKIKVDV